MRKMTNGGPGISQNETVDGSAFIDIMKLFKYVRVAYANEV
jgi:hypothetical protein